MPIIHLKSQLVPRPHASIPGATVFEVWYNGQCIATVNGADGPGVRITTKHQVAVEGDDGPAGLHMVDVLIDPATY